MAQSGTAANRNKRKGESAGRQDAPTTEPNVLSKDNLTPLQQEVVEHLGREKLVEMYRRMVLIRSFERRCEQAYQQRRIGGFLHLYMGQEAVGVGMLGALRPDDYVTTSFRDHGIALALGIPPDPLMAELFGKVTGVSRGKGGSMHFYSKEKNLLGGHAIVGGGIPVGVGAAFRSRYMDADQVSVIFFGDGAVQQGVFHESLNMAALWDLPAIFVIENNQYGMGTALARASAVTDMTLKAQGYDMEGVLVDGMNLLDCYGTLWKAVEQRRKNPAPLLVEAKTYRYRGHSISDPATYRAEGELEHYQQVDPIMQVRRLLDELGWMSEMQAKAIDREVNQEVAASYTFAEESEFPPPEELSMHVYAD